MERQKKQESWKASRENDVEGKTYERRRETDRRREGETDRKNRDQSRQKTKLIWYSVYRKTLKQQSHTHTHRRVEGAEGEEGEEEEEEEGSVSWRKLAALWCDYAADAVLCSAMHAGKTEQTGAGCEMKGASAPRLPFTS